MNLTKLVFKMQTIASAFLAVALAFQPCYSASLDSLSLKSISEMGVGLAFSKDGKYVIADDCGTIKIWDTTSGAILKTLANKVNPEPVGDIAVSPDGQYVAEVLTNVVQIRNLFSGEIIRSLDTKTNISSIAYSPDGSMLVTGHACIAKLWDVESGTLRGTLQAQPFTPWKDFQYVSFSPDGRKIISSGYNITV